MRVNLSMPVLSVGTSALLETATCLPSILGDVVGDGLVVEMCRDLGVEVFESVGDAAEVKVEGKNHEKDGEESKGNTREREKASDIVPPNVIT